MNKQSVLVVDDDANCLFGISQALEEEGYRVVQAENGREALKKLEAESVNVVVTDVRMSSLNGIQLLSEVKRINPGIPVILVTAYGSVPMAVEALKKGAFYFFEKPIFKNMEQFFAILRQAFRSQEMERELDHLRKAISEKYSFPNIVTNHSKMEEIFEIMGKVAKTDKTVLIQGESGTGKDLVAKTIHYNSPRKQQPLVTVNCGALTETLLTTELFGHKKGAFTGAVNDTIGRFQMANGGTLILDEISEIPRNLQKTLLRVIEEKEFERVGESRSTKIDVRILATTNRILRDEVSKGNFREDLFYRLSIVPLTIPPLRERASDIPLLINHFLKKFQEEKDPIQITPEALEQLKAYSWPGNVRELANVVQQMMMFCSDRKITTEDIPPFLSSLSSEERGLTEGEERAKLPKLVSDLERKWILKTLEECGWNKEEAADLLGLTRKMLTNRIVKYKIERLNN